MGPPPGPGGPDGGGDPVEILGQMQELAGEYLNVEKDEEDKLMMEQITTLIQKLKAKDQQDKDSALGGSNMRMLRRAG